MKSVSNMLTAVLSLMAVGGPSRLTMNLSHLSRNCWVAGALSALNKRLPTVPSGRTSVAAR